EAEQMTSFHTLTSCRLRFLRDALDDAEADDCGRCDNCTGRPLPVDLDPALVDEARRHLRSGDVGIEPRKQWPSRLDEPKGKIPDDRRAEWGRALCRVGDGGWGPMIDEVLRGERVLHTDMIRAVG